MSWPEVRSELEAGRDTVVVALGATEQHGPHLPLATDALIGDRLAWLVADRLDAFVAPTVRIGCSSHHLAFPGTLSLSDETFYGVAADLRQRLSPRCAAAQPRREFQPLGTALERLGPVDRVQIQGLTDVRVLLAIAQVGADEYGVSMNSGGLHADEWETSMLMAINPELVHLEKSETGYTGDLEQALGALFGQGVDAIASNGVIDDPAASTIQHGERYWAKRSRSWWHSSNMKGELCRPDPCPLGVCL